jgi:hypothetical protein
MAQVKSRTVAKSIEKPKPKKTKTAVSLTDDAIKRLGAACTVHQLDQSDIVEWLINQNLSGYVIQVRGPKIGIGPSDDQLNLAASVIADESADLGDHISSPAHLRV